jgi:hypothetical protein
MCAAFGDATAATKPESLIGIEMCAQKIWQFLQQHL